ncbi:hypothetical protein [Oceanicola sp. 502str15]|uniref:hypothetical protein n=1 Tax=Oceanicola sp. 502str15 TaxID=2696061 RepID=UPI0020941855|nr:hypothetical protein [Oceanicola sp. 502str15]MCO6385024.1 hypothetical protein [Oceanicola sp. 502str15]
MTSTQDRDPEIGGAFYVPAEAPDQLGVTTEQAARALAHPGFDAKQATAFFRNRVTAGHLIPYGRMTSDKRRPYLFRTDQVLVAAVQHRLAECGLTGDPMHAAFLALNAWDADDKAKLPNPTHAPQRPAGHVMRLYLTGVRNFGFELITLRNTAGRGDVAFSARVRRFDPETGNADGTSFRLPGPSWERRSIWATDLDPILAYITREKPVVN